MRRARALYSVAEYGSVSAAAEVLHVSSSALSQQLSKLEREIGQPLLVRRGRGVELTEAGALLARHTAEILERIATAEADLEAARGTVSGRMAIAAFATATRALLPTTMRRLREDHPELRVESHEYEPAQAIPLLIRGEIDIAVIDEWFRDAPVLPAPLEQRALLDDIADLAIPVDHELAHVHGPVALTSCTQYRWISWRPGEFGHDWLRSALAEHHPALHFAHTAGEHQTILALVDAGLGIALMPRLGRGFVPDGVLIKAVTPTITRRCFAVWRAEDGRRPAVAAALQALTHTADQH